MATPEENDCYKEMLKNLIKVNNEGGKLCNEKLQQAVIDLRLEMNKENEHNINNITCNDLYQSPMKKKDVSKINDSVYNDLDEHVDTTSDSRKQVDARNYPIKETHIVNGVSTLSTEFGSLDPDFIGIIGQVSTDLVTHVLTNSSKQLSMTSSSPLNTFQSKVFVIGSQDESVGGNMNIICTFRDSRNSTGNHSRIRTPGVNKDIFSPISDTTSNLLSCTVSIEKFDTHVHRSATQ